MKRFLLIIPFILFAVLQVSAQSIEELRNKKAGLSKQIEYMNSLMEKTYESKQQSVEALRLLQAQGQTREKLLVDMNLETDIISQRIENNEIVISLLQADLKKMKAEYAVMIRLAQVNNSAYDALTFLLSADDASQAYRRWLYLRQYSQRRSKQLEVINSVSAKVERQLAQLNEQKRAKENLLNQKQVELRELSYKEQELEQMLKGLSAKEKEIKSRVASQAEDESSLRKEIELSLKGEARKNLAHNVEAYTEFDKLGSEFQQNKGKLITPVANGVITEHFGVHQHPVLPNIKVQSNGVEITTSPGAHPRSVFGGVVSKVFEVAGGNKGVIIRHGTYLSVYSNLAVVKVKKGDNVKEGEELGVLFAKDGLSLLKFQIWKENIKLNPEEWIRN